MNPDLQQVVALVVVAVAVIGLWIHYRRQRRHPGCAAGCACPTKKLRR